MKHLPILSICLVAVCGCAKAPVVATEKPEIRALTPEQLIANGKLQVANDPRGAMGWSQLSLAYLSKSRKFDSYDDARLAEESARKSLSIRRNGNVAAAVRLTQSLLNQHRFRDAVESSRRALELAPHSPPAQVSRIECLIEVGHYDLANKLFFKHRSNLPEQERSLVQSRLLELYGQPEEAIRLVSQLLSAPSSPEFQAQLHTRLGDLHWSIRNLEAAEAHYSDALKLAPNTWRAMLGNCRVAHARGEWQKVVTLGHQVEELVAMTDVVSLMGDAFASLGDKKMAEEHFGEAAALAGYESAPSDHSHGTHGHAAGNKHGHPLDRQYARFAADHEIDLAKALKAAKADLRERQDIFGWDTLAWVHHKRGESELAKQAMSKALRTGTRDATILDHARIIQGG